MGFRVPATAVILAAGLLVPGSAAAQPAQAPDAAEAPALARIKHRLETPTPLLEATANTPLPTFRVSVSQKAFDIWSFWGEPEAVWKEVRPRFGSWHQEFTNMVTPDDFQGLGPGMGNGERAQLAATSMAFALAMQYLPGAIKNAFHGRAQRKAKEEVQRELEAFYALHPEARPAPAATSPP
jgi:hypothetical protein